MTYNSVYIAAESRDEAVAIGRALVEERLAACANVFASVKSLYWWEGAVQEDDEVILILKTRSGRLERLIERAKALHSYECPCIVAFPIAAGHPDYLDWIAAETA